MLSSPRQMALESILLHTALWTRPPTVSGYALADCWAWLRYARAFAPSPALRLCADWATLDPHQKTILSDEVAVGCTTNLLVDVFQMITFVDTLCFLKRTGLMVFAPRIGPMKTPDYIALDSDLRLYLIECKGSQQSLRTLSVAMDRGVVQKQSLTALPQSRVRESLVVGLAIPGATSRTPATIVVRDPAWEDVVSWLNQLVPEQIVESIVAITLAKHFALMGLSTLARDLLRSDGAHLTPLSPSLLRRYGGATRDTLSFETTLPLPVIDFQVRSPMERATRIRFRMTCPFALYEALTGTSELDGTLMGVGYASQGHSWSSIPTERGVLLSSPLGFTLSLDYDGE